MVSFVAEVGTRGLAEQKGFRDVPGLLRTVQNVSRSTARARVRAAEQLSPMHLITGQQVDPQLPVPAAAFEGAEVSAGHVRVIQRVLGSVPPHLDEHRVPLEADLVGHARTLDPDTVEKLGKHAVALPAPDGPRPRDPQPGRNRFSLRPQGNGVEARGWFDTESAAVLRARPHRPVRPGPAVPAPPPSDPCGRVEGRHGGRVPAVPPAVLGAGRSAAEPGAPARPDRAGTRATGSLAGRPPAGPAEPGPGPGATR